MIDQRAINLRQPLTALLREPLILSRWSAQAARMIMSKQGAGGAVFDDQSGQLAERNIAA